MSYTTREIELLSELAELKCLVSELVSRLESALGDSVTGKAARVLGLFHVAISKWEPDDG